MRVIAIYKGATARCNVDENYIVPRFEAPPSMVAKAVKAQVYWLERPLVLKIKSESGKVLGKAKGVLKRVDVDASRGSIWHFQLSLRDAEAVAWMPKAFQTNLILVLKEVQR